MSEKNQDVIKEMEGDQSAINVSLRSRRFKVGIYSMIITLIIIAIAAVVNIAISKLPTTMTKLDTSFNDMFTVTNQTVDILENLDQDVTVYLIATTGNENNAISEMLNRYQALSSHVKVIQRDPTLYPNFVSQYTEETLTNNSLIVESSKRYKVIDYNKIYSTEYTYSYLYEDYYTQTYFAGEDELTSAIDFVTTDTLPVVYSLTGHGERTLSDNFAAAVEKANLTVKELSLIADTTIPEDASCIFVNCPTSDLGSAEAEAILKYMTDGGDVLFVTYYEITNMPNFLRIFEAYGVTAETGYVVETTSGNYVNYGSYLLPNIESHDITGTLTKNNYHVLLPGGQGIKTIENYRSSLTIEPLLTTTSASYSKTNTSTTNLSKEDGDIDGPFTVGVAVTEDYLSETTKMVWYSSGYMIDDSINSLVGGGNSTLFVDTLVWMCDVQGAYTIPSHSLGVSALQTPTVWVYALTAILIVGIPGAVITIGAIKLHRRKKR